MSGGDEIKMREDALKVWPSMTSISFDLYISWNDTPSVLHYWRFYRLTVFRCSHSMILGVGEGITGFPIMLI